MFFIMKQKNYGQIYLKEGDLMRGKEVLKHLSPYQPGKQTAEIKKEFGLDRVIKLASNENPYGYSPQVKEYFMKNSEELNIYPDGHATTLRKAVAEKNQLAEDQLVFGSGSDELIQVICRTFLFPGANTVMATPTFSQYKHHSVIEGAEIKEIPVDDGAHNLRAMAEAIDENTEIVWICSPDNPSGKVIEEDALIRFMDQCPSDVLVVLDEAYYEYIEEEVKIPTIKYLNTYKNLLLLRTFSKAYGLAGLRVGYGMAHPHVITKLNIVRGPFNTNSLAQKLATIALADDTFIAETIRKNREVMDMFTQFLEEINWTYYPSQTNFLLINVPKSGQEVFADLIKYGFIIRPGELLGYPRMIRVTMGTEQDMIELQQVIKQLYFE